MAIPPLLGEAAQLHCQSHLFISRKTSIAIAGHQQLITENLVPSTWNWSGWTPHSHHQTAASETTSPERLALGASTDPQQHLDPSRFVPQAPFNQGFSYFLDQSQPDSSSSSTDLSASKWNQSYGTTPTMPMTIPGDHSLRSLSTSTSSTDSSVHGGDLLGGLDPTPVSLCVRNAHRLRTDRISISKRAHDPSAVRPGRGSAESRSRSGSAFSQIDPQNSLILQRRPSTDAPSFTENPSTYGPTINQQSSWLPSTGFAASPTSSIVSLPSYSPIQCGQQQQHQQHHSSDPTLWGQFNAFKLDSKSNLTSPASSTFSVCLSSCNTCAMTKRLARRSPAKGHFPSAQSSP